MVDTAHKQVAEVLTEHLAQLESLARVSDLHAPARPIGGRARSARAARTRFYRER
jgi:hypothetical protein